MRTLFILPILAVLSLADGCGYDVVETTELERLKAAQVEAARLKQENVGLTQQIATLKSVGRYQLHQNGFRTWRLDTVTGEDCLLLTSDADWKKPSIALQGCPPAQ